MISFLFLLFLTPLHPLDDSQVLTIEIQNCQQPIKSTVPGVSIYLGSAADMESRVFFGVTDSKGQVSKKLSNDGIDSLRQLVDKEGRIQVGIEGLGLETQGIQYIKLEDIGDKVITVCAQDKVIMHQSLIHVSSNPSVTTTLHQTYTCISQPLNSLVIDHVQPHLGYCRCGCCGCCCCGCCCCGCPIIQPIQIYYCR